MNLPELLSPAGGMEQLKAAVENGTDAVYMGGRSFSARANAVNFSDDEMRCAIEYAHVRGVNIYITMNTLIADSEMQQAVDAAGMASAAGADALIVQDLGFASLLKKHIPDLPLHLSTQGTVYSAEGIGALAPLGFSRVILARELTLQQIAQAAEGSPVPVEVFAHGALCVCYSGQCLISSLIGARSGNRGRCAQPCRLPYRLGKERGYLLSPRDLCTVELLPELIRAGVSALKIEGRMKSPEYVAIVTGVYRKYLDKCGEGSPYAVEPADLEDLLHAFDRGGFTTGYLRGRQGRALISREKSGAEAGRNVDRALMERAAASYTGRPRRRVTVHGHLTARVGEPLHFAVWDDRGHSAVAAGEGPTEEAVTRPLTEGAACAQLIKSGDTPFAFDECAADVDGRAAAKLSELNALRRTALELLERARADRYPDRVAAVLALPRHAPARPAEAGLSLFFWQWRDEYADVLRLTDRAYVPFTALLQSKIGKADRPKQLMAWLPPVTAGAWGELIRDHGADLQHLGADGILIGNAEHLELLKDCGLPLYAGASFNAFNGWALEVCARLGLAGVTLSHELTLGQIAALPDAGIEKEAAVYGRLPLMVSAHCPVGAELWRVQGGKPCGLCGGNAAHELVDRMGARFPVLCDPVVCGSVVLNGDRLAVPGLALRLADAGVSMLRLMIHDETQQDVARIVALFRRALSGEAIDELQGKGYTRGHYRRGV